MATKKKQTQAANEQSHGFKDSALGMTPEGWEVVTIEQITSRVGSGVTPTGGQDVYLPEGIKFVRSQNVTFEGLLLDDIAYIDLKTHAKMRRSEIFPNDVLLNITGASIGRCCVVPENFGVANVNQHVCTIRLKKFDRATSKYLCYALSSRIGQRQIEVLNAGGNREGLNYQQIRSFFIPYPSYPEQSAIATILSTADDAIEKTGQLIAKYKRIKQGLMQDLFRYGIDENGQIRSEQTHRFKDSPLGRIPEEWEVVTFNKVTQDGAPICYGIVQPGEYIPFGIPVLSIQNLNSDYKTNIHLCDPYIAKQYSRSRIESKDVLLAIKGTIGNIGIVPPHFTGNISRDLAKIRLKLCVLPEYAYQMLKSPTYQDLFQRIKVGTTRAEISIKILKGLPFFLLPLPEQSRIAAVLAASDAAIEKEEAYRHKLLALKRGLMEDLLAGKERVTGISVKELCHD